MKGSTMQPTELLKLAEKSLNQRKLVEGLAALLNIFVQKPTLGQEPNYQRIYKKAGLHFARALHHKQAIQLVLKLIQGTPQESLIFIGHIAAEFGQLHGAIQLVIAAYPPLEMELPLFNFLIDVLDSFNDRKQALALVIDYCKHHPQLSVGGVSCGQSISNLDVSVENTTHSMELLGNIEYSNDDLQVLELYFKMLKLAYTQGQLSFTRAIIQNIKIAVLQGKDLHLTRVRNGNSYFGYLSTLLELNSKQEISELPILHCIGDSHSLSLGFETLNLDHKTYFIKPELVTGCKIWHLRPSSHFHAKKNFEKVVFALPDRADVLFLFGEIDCREGILKAIEKGLYPSIPDAIKVLLTIYFNQIEIVRKIKHLNLILIHPVPPVLNETRPIVRIFNQMLKEKVESRNKKITHPNHLFHYLDIEDKLLTNNQLNPEYHLDGTHLHPKYKICIEGA
jgi:hypothetical protein